MGEGRLTTTPKVFSSFGRNPLLARKLPKLSILLNSQIWTIALNRLATIEVYYFLQSFRSTKQKWASVTLFYGFYLVSTSHCPFLLGERLVMRLFFLSENIVGCEKLTWFDWKKYFCGVEVAEASSFLKN